MSPMRAGRRYSTQRVSRPPMILRSVFLPNNNAVVSERNHVLFSHHADICKCVNMLPAKIVNAHLGTTRLLSPLAGRLLRLLGFLNVSERKVQPHRLLRSSVQIHRQKFEGRLLMMK